jgi:molybdate/tungstate transport system substrate-binding protein
VTTALGTLTGKPIIYGLTIPSNAPDPALARRFVEFVLSPPGQAIMRGSGFVVISPALAANHSAVPAGLRSTTTAWAPPAG